MKIHILGACGTFMGGIAQLAKKKGFDVVGFDENIYPPMSEQLAKAGIELVEGYQNPEQLSDSDCVLIGNAMTRGNPAVEYVLNHHLTFMSGPEWLAKNILKGNHVLAISGTHGKTTTSAMLAWILKQSGANPGYLIGGVPLDLSVSAQLGSGKLFVVEADEYDSAFFDKRSKFIHYHPDTLVINNIEFDHADIFCSLEDIQKQFHHLVRTVSERGCIIVPAEDGNIQQVLDKGCWSKLIKIGAGGSLLAIAENKSESVFNVLHQDELLGVVDWSLIGRHNMLNGLAAIVAAMQVGVSATEAISALNSFGGVKRRLERIGLVEGIAVYDDFAHHPTAIASTLAGLRHEKEKGKILLALDLASHTMRSGYHSETLPGALKAADEVYMLEHDLTIEASNITNCQSVDEIILKIVSSAKTGDSIVLMSNRGFEDIHQKLLKKLHEK